MSNKSNKRKSLLPLTAIAALLVTGAFNRQALFSTSPAPPTPLARTGMTPGEWISCDTPAWQVFEDFLSRHGPDKIDWLRLDIWQRMTLDEFSFESDGRLVLGPGRCARLEMRLRGGCTQTRVQVISDGTTMAKSVRLPDAAPTVTTALLSSTREPGDAGRNLASEGCCGPDTILRRFAPVLTRLTVQRQAGIDPGLVRVAGECNSEAAGFSLPPGRRLRCRLYFEEATFWLARVEWSIFETDGERVILEMEYRNPVINVPMSEEECSREFTFRNES